MIDISQETLVPIRDVPRLLPPRPNGKRVHISAVYRWMSRGIHGVVLESAKIGGSVYTSSEALQRWAEQLAAVRFSRPAPEQATPQARERQLDRTSRSLQDILTPARKRRSNPA